MELKGPNMNALDELVKGRMMRGALVGSAEPEKAPMLYCKGKLDNGRPCRVVMLGDEEYCLRHRREIEALEAGAPIKPGGIERAQKPQEGDDVAKYRCGKEGCGRSVKNEGEMCWQHKGLEDQVAAGALGVAGEGLGKSGQETTVEPPPQEQVEVAPASLSALTRLLKPAMLQTPPLSPTSILLDFNQEEFAAIQFEKVTGEDLKRLALMLIAGELGQIVQAEDPLVKSRGNAA